MLQAAEMESHIWLVFVVIELVKLYIFRCSIILFQLPPERKSCFGIRCS
jgi:hypothetical protein